MLDRTARGANRSAPPAAPESGEPRQHSVECSRRIGGGSYRAADDHVRRAGLRGLLGRDNARLVVATDLYTWKLLRRDFGKSRNEVAQLMADMIEKETGGGT